MGRNISRNVAVGEALCFHYQRHFVRLLANADFIAGLHEPRGDVALYAVYINVAVAHDLASREDRRRELGAVDNSIQTAFQETDKVLASVALHTGGFKICLLELLFGHIAIIALQLLLRAQLNAEVGHLALKSAEHTSDLPSLMRISYAVFCL